MEEELIYTPTKKTSLLSYYVSGAIAGVVSIAVSHPADTVKVRNADIPVFDLLFRLIIQLNILSKTGF